MGHDSDDDRIEILIETTTDDKEGVVLMNEYDFDTLDLLLSSVTTNVGKPELTALLRRLLMTHRAANHPSEGQSVRVPDAAPTSPVEQPAAASEKSKKVEIKINGLTVGEISVAYGFKASVEFEKINAYDMSYIPGRMAFSDIKGPQPIMVPDACEEHRNAAPGLNPCRFIWTIGAELGDPVYCTTHVCGAAEAERCNKMSCPHCKGTKWP